jgi:hypothetical protein
LALDVFGEIGTDLIVTDIGGRVVSCGDGTCVETMIDERQKQYRTEIPIIYT